MGNEEDLYLLNIDRELVFDASGRSYSLKEINNAISYLPELYRHPLSMYVIGYRCQDIATCMNLPLGIVKSRIFHARKNLQLILKEYKKDL